jgi:hypothetical protein
LIIKVEEVKLSIAVIGLIGILLFASPTIALLIKPPNSQQFSEIYLLGGSHTFENLPFNIKVGEQYFVYLGVINNMDSSSYYTLLVKLANETQLPSATSAQPSSLPSLFEYKTFLPVGQSFESPLSFQINNLKVVNNVCTLSDIRINGVDIQINKESVWNSKKSGYYYNLFIELWIFNDSLGTTQYNNRFVSLNLNMTV